MPLDGNNPTIKDPAHFFRAKREDIISLLEDGDFNIIKDEVIDTYETWKWAIPSSHNKMIIVIAKKPSRS